MPYPSGFEPDEGGYPAGFEPEESASLDPAKWVRPPATPQPSTQTWADWLKHPSGHSWTEFLARRVPPMIATGAAFAAGPASLPAQGAIGAASSVATDYWNKLMDHFFGEQSAPLTLGGEAKSAALGGVMGAVPTVAEAGLGLRTARTALEEAPQQVEKEALESQAAGEAKAQAAQQKAQPEIAEQTLQTEAQKMVGKTPETLAQQEAGPYYYAAERRARAQDPFFTAASKFHEDVGAKFEPYVGKVKDKPLDPMHASTVTSSIDAIEKTLEDRGQVNDNAELKKIFAEATGKSEIPSNLGGPIPANVQALLQKQYGQMAQPELTYGQLWGMRARANKVLSSARNPGVRYAANKFVTDVTNLLPNVPDSIREQYSFERNLLPDLTGKVADATSPRGVGAAVFGSKDPQVPLNTIRFVKKYQPGQLTGLRDSFADWYLGNKLTSEDLGKMNPAVLDELYGSAAGPVKRLLGPEGDAKACSIEELVAQSPQAGAQFKEVWDRTMRDHALDEGEDLLRSLPADRHYNEIRRQVAQIKNPDAKLALLRRALPTPEELSAEKALTQTPKGRFEGYFQRRLAFDGALALMSGGGVGMLSHHPGIGAAMAVGLGVRAGVRYALSNPSIAARYLRILESSDAAYIAKFLSGAAVNGADQAAKSYAETQ